MLRSKRLLALGAVVALVAIAGGCQLVMSRSLAILEARHALPSSSGMVAVANVLADAVLIAHLAVIAFNLFGLIAIPLGARLGWRFVRARRWRLVHLALLAVVALQGLAGRACILTILQDDLTGGGHRPEPMIMAFVNRMIFWPLPLWVFTAIYVAVWLYALALWWIVPPTDRASALK